LKLSSENAGEYPITKAILEMFVGKTPVVLYFSDTKIRRGTTCMIDPDMLQELKSLLGEENVVLR